MTLKPINTASSNPSFRRNWFVRRWWQCYRKDSSTKFTITSIISYYPHCPIWTSIPIFDDSHLSQDILRQIANYFSLIFDDSPPTIDYPQTKSITETLMKPTSTQSLPFFGPSLFAHCKTFENFFLPSNTFLKVPFLLQAQKDDPVLSTVYKWPKQKQRPYTRTLIFK